jgi:hypothetical protein
MDKTDYKKELGEFYGATPGKMVTVVVPKMNFIMVDGKGDPNKSQEYIDAIQTLYPLAYTLKFMCKKGLGQDFSVMPLEGLWWMEDMTKFSADNKDEWLWTAMIMQPPVVTREMFDKAVKLVVAKKAPVSLNKARFEAYDEGRSAQVMYIGPYANEGLTIRALHEFIKEQGGKLNGANKKHHEIYFSDPRRTDPSKLKTIIRQPY